MAEEEEEVVVVEKEAVVEMQMDYQPNTNNLSPKPKISR